MKLTHIFLPRLHRRSPYHPSQGKHAKANPQNLLQSQVFIVKSHSYVLSRPQRFSFLILLSTATTHTMMATLLIMVNERSDLNIAKGTTDLRVEFISQLLTQILIKFHLQNLEQVSTSKSQPNISNSTKLTI